MANEEHKLLAQFIKDVHLTLRKSTLKLGAVTAWQNHCRNCETLSKYAQYMEKLATTHWENNCNSDNSEATSRIKWVVDFCYDYFINQGFLKYAERENEIAQKINADILTEEPFTIPLKLIDVGSCYNPFKIYDIFDVLAIDLCPANASVLQCDFLNVNVGKHDVTCESALTELQENSFDIVTFCFLLEYIPTSELRIIACEKAYRLLKPGGVLVIITPDSKHVGANSKLIKCWRYTLAFIGFSRIKYEKTKYMHCMVFRKALNKDITIRWAMLHKEQYMEYAIHIPQDFNAFNHFQDVELSSSLDKEAETYDFQELPFTLPDDQDT